MKMGRLLRISALCALLLSLGGRESIHLHPVLAQSDSDDPDYDGITVYAGVEVDSNYYLYIDSFTSVDYGLEDDIDDIGNDVSADEDGDVYYDSSDDGYPTAGESDESPSPVASGHEYGVESDGYACYDDGEGDCDWEYVGPAYASIDVASAAPNLTSLSASTVTVGTQGTLTITGTHIVGTAEDNPTISYAGTGITFTPTGTPTPTQAQFSYKVNSTAPVGTHNITLTTQDGTSNGLPLTVGYPPAVITGLSSYTWLAGTTFPLTITGTGFGTQPTVTITAAGVTPLTTTTSSTGTSIQIPSVAVTANAPNEPVAIVVTPGYPGSGFICGIGCTGTGSGTSGATVAAEPPPVPTINLLNGTTNSPYAGQAISLSVSPPSNSNLTIASQSWAITKQSDAVAGYTVTYSNGTPVSACFSPVVPSAGPGICTGSNLATTQANLGPFYFIVSGQSETVTVTVTYNLAGGGTSSTSPPATQAFTIRGPTVNLKATMPTDGSGVQVYSFHGQEWLGVWGVTGNEGNPITGIYFQSNATSFPGGANGVISWVQTISSQQSKYLRSSGNVTDSIKTGLDTDFPYDLGDNTADRPADELLANYGEDWRTFTATMYAMWDPALPSGCQPAYSTISQNSDGSYTSVSIPSTCTQSIPIPVSSVTYDWSGCAINTLANHVEPDTSTSTWVPSTLNGCPKQTLGTPALTRQFPTWTTLGNY